VSDLDLVVGSGGQDGHASGLNDLRQVVFSAKFTDGSSGVFLTTIPAPAGGAVALVGLGLLGTRRRRRAM
jgi:MYXO-CTERM domain-containing protein